MASALNQSSHYKPVMQQNKGLISQIMDLPTPILVIGGYILLKKLKIIR